MGNMRSGALWLTKREVGEKKKKKKKIAHVHVAVCRAAQGRECHEPRVDVVAQRRHARVGLEDCRPAAGGLVALQGVEEVGGLGETLGVERLLLRSLLGDAPVH